MVTEAPAARAMLDEASARWPTRSRVSDGILPSAAHTIQNPTSDHERGDAVDLTDDPSSGCDVSAQFERIAANLIAGVERRPTYLIHDRRIFNLSIAPWWRPYHGSNPHTSHGHTSIDHDRRNDVSSWFGEGDDEIMGDQADRIEAKLDKLLVITAKRGALARLNARVKAVLRGERRKTERTARRGPQR